MSLFIVLDQINNIKKELERIKRLEALYLVLNEGNSSQAGRDVCIFIWDNQNLSSCVLYRELIKLDIIDGINFIDLSYIRKERE